MSLPTGWAQARLDEVAEVRLGRQRSPDKAFGDNLVPYLRAANVRWGGLDLSDVKTMQFSPAEVATFQLRRDDILVVEASGSRNEVGKSALWNDELPLACLQNTLLRVRSRGVDPTFLRWRLHYDALVGGLGGASKGIGIHHIGADRLSSWSIGLPPLNEQRRIVATLDATFEQTRAAKARLERLPALLENLKRSILAAAFRGDLTKDWRAAHPDVEPATVLLEHIRLERRRRRADALRAKGKEPSKALYEESAQADIDGRGPVPEGWAWATLGELCDVGTGATPKRGDPRFWSAGTIPWVTSGATNSEFIDAATEFVTENALEETNLTLFPPGTLLVAMYGEGQTRGRCAELRLAATTNQAVAALVTASVPTSMKDLIKFVLWDRYEALRMEASGGVQPNLNLGIVRGIVVPVPPLQEQDALIARLRDATAAVRALVIRLSDCNSRVDRVEQSALAKAFRGELVPQDPTDEPAAVLLDRIRAARATEPDRPRRGRSAGAAQRSVLSNGNGSAGEPADLVAAAFQQDPRLTAAKIRDVTGLDAVAVKQALAVLVDSGVVRPEGRKRGATYVWTA